MTRLIRKLSVFALATIAIALIAPPAHANKLKEILDRGVVRIAVLLDLPPYGFSDQNQKPAGLDIDLANILAKDLKVKLKMQQITGINRIPYLLTDKVDLIIACFGATPTRARQVAFSSPYASLYLGVFGPKDLPVKSAADLGTYSVGAPRGTTQDIGVTELAKKYAPNAKIVRFDDEATTIAAQLSGQVDMFATANFTFTEIAKRNPQANLAPKFVIRVSSCHIGLRQGEPDLLRWVDTFIFHQRVTGTLNDLHQKWMGEDMKPLPTF
jgi:polar amino acid transport system substrate-binding protein